jgi:hypothetical protein
MALVTDVKAVLGTVGESIAEAVGLHKGDSEDVHPAGGEFRSPFSTMKWKLTQLQSVAYRRPGDERSRLEAQRTRNQRRASRRNRSRS